MMRFCPKCGDYSADSSLAFCLSDGTPLVSLDPTNDKWSEGAKVIEKKQQAFTRKHRRLKWRRLAISTMMVLTLIAFGLAAAHSRFYLEPPPPTPTPTPTPSPSPTPSPTPSPSPSPTRVTLTSTPTTPTPTPTPDCSGNEKEIKKRLPNQWQEEIRSECAKFNIDTKGGLQTATPVVSPMVVNFKSCIASVTIRYSCQLTLNKKETSLLPGKPKTFRCEKKKGTWVCKPT